MSKNTFHFSLVSPEKVLMSEQITMVTIPGSDGEFGVLPNHAPILSSLKDGVVIIDMESGITERVFVAGGFADMNDNVCTLLAQEAVNVNDIDVVSLEKQREVLNEKLDMLSDGEGLTQNKSQIVRQLGIIKQKLALSI